LATYKVKKKVKVPVKVLKKTSPKKIKVILKDTNKSNIKKLLKPIAGKGKVTLPEPDKNIRYRPSKRLKSVLANPLNLYSANLGYNRGKRALTFAFINNVFASMTGNSNFETPSPAISDIKDEIALYRTARGNKNTGAAKQCYVNILYMMKQLGNYVANECGNDPVVFASSSFIPNKAKGGKSKEIAQAKIKKVKDTKRSGEAKAFVIALLGAQWYKGYWIDTEDETATKHYTKGCKGIKHLFKGLPVGKKLLLFVCGSGPLGDGDWSLGFPWMPR